MHGTQNGKSIQQAFPLLEPHDMGAVIGLLKTEAYSLDDSETARAPLPR